jgi:acetyl esterase/lipase
MIIRSRIRWYWLLVLFWLVSLSLAQPGALIGATRTARLQPTDVSRLTAGRFNNNGVRAPSPQNDVIIYLITFESTDLNGQSVPITAQVFVPVLDSTEAPIFIFAPGSTGLVEACAPSRPYVQNRGWETYSAYTLAYAGQGFISVMPNYMGFFNDEMIQPYFVRVAEGRVMLDAARATTALLEQEGFALEEKGVFVGGFSQGGHAALATADLHAEYAPEVNLLGVLGFGATTQLPDLFREFTFVAPLVLHAYNTFFPGQFDPAEVLAEPYASSLAADAERLCIEGVQGHYPGNPANLYTPAFFEALMNDRLEADFPGLAALFAENNAGLSSHGLPAIILQGVDDPVVTLSSQNRFVRQLCDNGSPVRYPNYLRTRHETRYIGFDDAIGWMRALVAGETPPSDCDAL